MSLVTRPELRGAVEALWWRAALTRPSRTLTVLSGDPRGAPEQVTWEALLLEARGAAAGLQAQGVEPGRPFLLVAPTERSVLTAFLGGLLLGAQPVPVHPPLGLNGLDAWLEHLQAAGAALGVEALVATPALLALLPADGAWTRIDASALPAQGEPADLLTLARAD